MERFSQLHKRTTWGRYFLIFSLCYLVIVLLLVALNVGGEKQVVVDPGDTNQLLDFAMIVAQNTLVFFCVFSLAFTRKASVYIFVFANAVRVGLLISHFMYINYLILVLPHGILETAVYLMLGSLICEHLDNSESTTIGSLLRKALPLYILLLVAGGIEAWVTPYLVRSLLLV